MESPYDSDVSEDTRELIAKGLATDIKRYKTRAELGSIESESARTHSMNTSYVRLPPALVVQAEEPSAWGLNLTRLESVRGQKHNSNNPTFLILANNLNKIKYFFVKEASFYEICLICPICSLSIGIATLIALFLLLHQKNLMAVYILY